MELHGIDIDSNRPLDSAQAILFIQNNLFKWVLNIQ